MRIESKARDAPLQRSPDLQWIVRSGAHVEPHSNEDCCSAEGDRSVHIHRNDLLVSVDLRVLANEAKQHNIAFRRL